MKSKSIKYFVRTVSVLLSMVITNAAYAQQTNPPWGLDRIDQRNLPLSGTYQAQDNVGGVYNGTGVHVYVVDEAMKTTHQEFEGRIGIGFSPRQPTVPSHPIDECDSHGTHVAGIIGGRTYGVAKRVTLHSVKIHACWSFITRENSNGDLVTTRVFDLQGGTGITGKASVQEVIDALDWIRTNHYRNYPNSRAVVNLSFSIVSGVGTPAQMSSLDKAVNNLIDAGIVVVIAAANDNSDACNVSPARVPRALTVAASTQSDRKLNISNRGSCIDLFAPGDSILSAAWNRTSNSATMFNLGTSQAAPHVAGVAALYLERDPTMTVAQVTSAIVNSATNGVLLGSIGSGSPNKLLYFGTNGVFPARGSNSSPIARNDNIGDVDAGDNMFLFPLRNDSDPNNDPLRIVSVTQPSGGRVTIESNGTELYLVPNSRTGNKSFTYMITDGRGRTAQATISYRVVN